VPLTRFYASHQAELPAVFRAIQIAPVWRAERPQKGRYRQFMQCDIDIIGEAGPLAELELLTATAATLRALGLTGWSIRINDRRILVAMLDHFGIARENHERAMITIDKEDKIGVDGVVAELREYGITDSPAVGPTLQAAATLADDGWSLLDEPPAWLDIDAYRTLRSIREGVPDARLVFSPNLVRGMGYYTGAIFEVAHPESSSSLGGGGRYDGMVGRFLGRDVPATGFSIGFERIVDLVELPGEAAGETVALLYDADVEPATLVALKSELAAVGYRVRLEKRPKNVKSALDALAASGFSRFAFVGTDVTSAAELKLRDLG
jgi:histidyl-tRNA synthetase